MDLAVLAIAFGTIFIVELPDKTFIATLVLSTRYRPLLVWIGVGLAFFVQTGIAVSVGQVATLLPADVVQGVAAAIFVVGAVLLLREARHADEEEAHTEQEYAAKAADPRSGWRAVLASFLVLFAAEWGDLSQLLTISVVGKYGEPISVFLGAWGALLAVSGLAVVAGRFLLQRVKLSVIHYIGAAVCLGLAAFTLLELLG